MKNEVLTSPLLLCTRSGHASAAPKFPPSLSPLKRNVHAGVTAESGSSLTIPILAASYTMSRPLVAASLGLNKSKKIQNFSPR